jgi:quercetin dioxygenase-like cupin family protein
MGAPVVKGFALFYLTSTGIENTEVHVYQGLSIKLKREAGMKLSDCIINAEQVAPYSPDAHVGTENRRIIGKETVGSDKLEIVQGIVHPGGMAEPHFHSNSVQVIYLLEGRAEIEMLGEHQNVSPGDTVYIPPGEMHKVTVLGDKPAKFLLVYTPPIQTADTPFER